MTELPEVPIFFSCYLPGAALCMFTRSQGCALILELNTLERLINAIYSFVNLTINLPLMIELLIKLHRLKLHNYQQA